LTNQLKKQEQKNEQLRIDALNLTQDEELRKNRIDELSIELKQQETFAEERFLRIAQLEKEGEEKQNVIDELTSQVKNQHAEAEAIRKNIGELQLAEKNSQEQLDRIAGQIKEKADKLNGLGNNLTARENEIVKLETQMSEKLKEFNESNARQQKIFETIEAKQKELFAIEESLTIKSKRLIKLSTEVVEIEAKHKETLDETRRLEELKSDLHKRTLVEQDTYDRLSKEKEKIKELLPLLEQRRQEIEKGNIDLENRFTRMFQRFNSEMNEINKKRNVLEQIVVKKEKDIEEKDQMLFEKINALEESERVLSMRQAEIDSFEQLLKTFNEKKDLLRTDLLKIDEQAVGRKNYNDDLKLESELLLKKKTTLEQSLQELLNTMNQKFIDTKDRRSKAEKDVRSYEERVEEFNQKISESMDELVELQSAISMIKVEHEEHRGNIVKLASMKKKLQEEITKSQRVLQRYQKIREKLKIEQSILKNRQDSIARKISIDDSAEINENQQEQESTRLFKI
jgi:chromosome segregation ATPase